MPAFILFLFLFFWLLKKESRANGNLIIFALCIYIILIIIEQLHLEHFYLRSFHISDPSVYFNSVYKLSFDGLLNFAINGEYKSNEFYYIINWIFYKTLFNETLTAIMIKVTNALVFLSAYMLLCRSERQVDYINYILLFHPYLLLLITRNVRDAYIIFFLALFVKSLTLWNATSENIKSWMLGALSFVFMLIIRPFFCLVMLLIPMTSVFFRTRLLVKMIIIFVLLVTIIVIFRMNIFNLKAKIISAIFSVFTFHEGYDAEREQVAKEIIGGDSGGLGFDLLAQYLKRIFQGIPVFLFTPHPINYLLKFLAEQRKGIWNIYTNFDNIMIIIGSILNYLIVIPMFLKYMHNIKSIRIDLLIICIYMFLMYSLFQFGITDVRIKYTFIFFVLLGLKISKQQIINFKTEYKYVIPTMAIFIIIWGSSK